MRGGAEFAAGLAGGHDAAGGHGDACHDAVSGAGVLAGGLGGVDCKPVGGGEGGDLGKELGGDDFGVHGESEVVGVAGVDEGGAATAEDAALGGQAVAQGDHSGIEWRGGDVGDGGAGRQTLAGGSVGEGEVPCGSEVVSKLVVFARFLWHFRCEGWCHAVEEILEVEMKSDLPVAHMSESVGHNRAAW